MAPNLFICLRTAFVPKYWFRSGVRVHGSIVQDEHWTEPTPGTYRYVPGHGWHLIRRDDTPADAPISPEPVVYCEVVNRYLLASDIERRCRSSVVTGKDGKMQRFRFFRLDDGVSWVAAWDDKDRLIQGPYRRWCLDKESGEMRLMTAADVAELGLAVSGGAVKIARSGECRKEPIQSISPCTYGSEMKG
ncbi:hypothetical protein AJ80_09973 [Polytolypa hystricis UAMH7299]|uniref:Uncharacterized protein n=1 Tax=Polytolypa hystricis (strain UAMH7299) TaxID=1447883 RepID=A0A2B7WFG4_POLH7|nr:hypothetical protein AJ80_09973 [Polytolypa hystricis UAMH7299]